MPLNLGRVIDDVASFNEVECVEAEFALLKLENEINNYCNALEIIRLAQKYESNDVQSFANELLGTSTEELVKDLGRKQDSNNNTVLKIRSNTFNYLRKIESGTLVPLRREFERLLRSADTDIKVEFYVPNVGKFAPSIASKIPKLSSLVRLSGKHLKVNTSDACENGIMIINVLGQLIDMALQSLRYGGANDSTQTTSNSHWRKYQYIVGLTRRLVTTLRANKTRIETALAKSNVKRSHLEVAAQVQHVDRSSRITNEPDHHGRSGGSSKPTQTQKEYA